MARANRHHLPGCIWHITHRCHKKEFLLKFAHDRSRFVSWLLEARKRFSLKILNYTITSNHIHLLVQDNKDAKSIPAAIQLVAGRTAGKLGTLPSFMVVGRARIPGAVYSAFKFLVYSPRISISYHSLCPTITIVAFVSAALRERSIDE